MTLYRRTFFDKLSLIGITKERNIFLENFSSLLNSGMPLIEALTFVTDDLKNPVFKKIIRNMTDDIGSGVTLSESMERAAIFSPHIISLVRVGQSSGRLIENMGILVTELKKSQEMNGKIRSALMYPSFVFALVLIVGLGISWFILPKLAMVFDGLDLDIPPITRALMQFGHFLDQYGIIAVPSFLTISFCLFYLVFIYKRTRFVGEILLFHIPIINRLIRESEIAKFGFLLGTLLKAGLSPYESLDSVAKSSHYIRYKKLYESLVNHVTDGFSFRQSFQMYPHIALIIPNSIQQIITSGEQSGTLSMSLLKLGESYDKRIEQTTKDLSVMLEPVMLVIVWFGVVGLALSVILPVYNLIGGLK